MKIAADLGYKYVEFAGFFGNSAEDVKAWMDEYGVSCCSTHTGIPALKPDQLEQTIQYHKTIGCDYLIVPGADWSTEEKMNENIDVMNYALPILKEAGITLGYHNHSHEFIVNSYGKVLQDEIATRCPDIEFEIDTFWAFNARLDPLEVLERFKDRIRMIHLKDGIPAPVVGQHAPGRSLGEGEAPVKAVRERALERGWQMVVESEGLSPTGPEEVGRCISFLRSLD